MDLALASENISQINLIQYLLVQILRPFQSIGLCERKPTLMKEKTHRFIWNNILEKLYTETLERELNSVKLEEFDKLQTDKMKNINFEIENLHSPM